MQRQLKLLEYTLSALLRRKWRNLSLLLVYSLLIAALGSVLLLTAALKQEATGSLRSAPELVVQQIAGGRHELIPVSYAETIRELPGVAAVQPRVWGYFYDSLLKANLTLIGVEGSPGPLSLLEGRFPQSAAECAVGSGVVNAFGSGQGELLVLEDSGGRRAEYRIAGTFDSASSLLTNDLVVMTTPALRTFFNMPDSLATDLAVEVHNPREVKTLAKKIRYHFPNSRPLTRDEILHTYETLFNWRSGMLLAVSAAALLAFVILAWDRATGMTAEEKREIGILKALGWETGDVLTVKFWEGLVISLLAFLTGLLAAWIHVFVFGAPALVPLLKGWSVLFPDFRLIPAVDFYQLTVLGVLTIVPYLACTLIPSWKSAIIDPDRAMRN